MNTATAKPINVQFSGAIPRNYDAHLGPLFFEPFSRLLGERVAALAPKHVLELACGTGRLTRQMALRLEGRSHIVATDINPAMLEFAQQGLPEAAIEWNTVDAVSLPYPDGSFDLVVAQFGVMFYSDRVQAYREALRVLKPGGRLLFTCWDRISENPAARLTQAVIERFFPIDPPAFYTVPFAYHESALIHEELLRAGFGRVQLELLTPHGEAASAEAATQGLLEGSPIRTAILDRDPDALPEMKELLAADLVAEFGTAELDVPLSAWAVEARV